MITDFDDLCLWTYVIVDDMLIKLAPLLRRPGPCPDCSDSELITMILIAECKGWDIETQLHRNLANTGIYSLYCLVRAGSTGADVTWGHSSIGFGRCCCQTLKGLKRSCVLLIVYRFQSFSFILHPRHQMIGHAMVPIMVESNQPNRLFSAINCIC